MALKRLNLKIFRIRQNMTQDDMARRIGCDRATYSAVETGARNPSVEFFMDLQKAFNVPDEEMWGLTRLE